MPANTSETHHTFLLQEASDLRSALTATANLTSADERFALLVAGAVYSWYYKDASTNISPFVSWIPFGTTALLGLRALALRDRMIRLTRYLRELEGTLLVDGKFGWQGRQPTNEWGIRHLTAFAFWTILQLGTVAIPYFVHR